MLGNIGHFSGPGGNILRGGHLPWPSISGLITGVLLLHLVERERSRLASFATSQWPLPPAPRACRCRCRAPASKNPRPRNGISPMARASSTAIEAYKKKGSAYPVFFVSRRNGGMYAAYHPALSLARLTDQCPELPITSSVSVPYRAAASGRRCSRSLARPSSHRAERPGEPVHELQPYAGPEFDNALQTKIGEFSAPTSSRRSLPLHSFSTSRASSSLSCGSARIERGSRVRVRDGMA